MSKEIDSIRTFGECLQQIYPPLQVEAFVNTTLQRLKNLPTHRVSALPVAVAMGLELRNFLPSDYPSALWILLGYLDQDHQLETDVGLHKESICHFIEQFGLEDFEVSMRAFYALGQKGRVRTWGLRELVRRYPQRALILTKGSAHWFVPAPVHRLCRENDG